MPNIAFQRLDDYVYAQRWKRQTALIVLLAASDGPRSLTIPELRLELRRSRDGAKWDQRLLRELAVDRVLVHWPASGRRPTLWAINPDVDRWRNVPWRPEGRATLGLTTAVEARSAAVEARFPRSEAQLRARSAPETTAVEALTRAFVALERATTAEQRATTADLTPSDQDFSLRERALMSAGGAPLSMPFTRLPSEDSSSCESDDDDEATRTHAEGRLRAALSRSVGPIFGRPAEALDRIEAAAGDHLAALERFTAGLQIRSPVAAVDAIRDHAAALARPPRRVNGWDADSDAASGDDQVAGVEAARAYLVTARNALGQ